jgi:hypothetical protein
MFCWDGLSCHERYSSRQYFMSSQPWASQMAQGGIFDTVNSAFGNANRVYVKVRAFALYPALRCPLTGSAPVPASSIVRQTSGLVTCLHLPRRGISHSGARAS